MAMMPVGWRNGMQGLQQWRRLPLPFGGGLRAANLPRCLAACLPCRVCGAAWASASGARLGCSGIPSAAAAAPGAGQPGRRWPCRPGAWRTAAGHHRLEQQQPRRERDNMSEPSGPGRVPRGAAGTAAAAGGTLHRWPCRLAARLAAAQRPAAAGQPGGGVPHSGAAARQPKRSSSTCVHCPPLASRHQQQQRRQRHFGAAPGSAVDSSGGAFRCPGATALWWVHRHRRPVGSGAWQ